ncbi:MAG: cation transporter [Firmicutes bacterium]|nr:cation transporter [Bacillota bacterium]
MLKKSKKPTIRKNETTETTGTTGDDGNVKLKKDKLQKLQNEMLILKISAIVGAAIGLAEMVMCTMVHSQSILIDGIYDFVEVVFLLVYLFFLPMVYKPYNQKMPYGYAQIETVFIIIKTLGLIVATIFVLKESICSIFTGGNVVDGGMVSRFEFAVALACLAGYLILRHLNGRADTAMLEMELYSWKIDVLLSFAIAGGYMAQSLLQGTALAWTTPYVDPAIAICIAVAMLPEPVRLLKEAMGKILLRAPGEETVRDIRGIVSRCLAPYEYEATFFDIVQTGRQMWVYVYVKSKDGVFHLDDLKEHNRDVYRSLSRRYDNVDIELIPDVN